MPRQLFLKVGAENHFKIYAKQHCLTYFIKKKNLEEIIVIQISAVQ